MSEMLHGRFFFLQRRRSSLQMHTVTNYFLQDKSKYQSDFFLQLCRWHFLHLEPFPAVCKVRLKLKLERAGEKACLGLKFGLI